MLEPLSTTPVSDSDSESSDEGGAAGLMTSMADFYGIDTSSPAPQQNDNNSEYSSGAEERDGSHLSGGSPRSLARNAKGERDNINSAEFDSFHYVRELLNASRTEDLVAKDAKMVQEIRALDSDMQMLVYENYNKFISATETIRRMKGNVGGMEDDMRRVKGAMESIGGMCDALDGKLGPKWSRVGQLVRLRSLLTRLSFLQEMPERLGEMVKSGKFDRAVKLYSQTKDVLSRYSHVASLRNIQVKTSELMDEVRTIILDGMEDASTEASEITRHMRILREMGTDPAPVVSRFLMSHKHRATVLLTRFQESLSSVRLDDASSADDHRKAVSDTMRFHQNFFVGLIEATKGIQALCGDGTKGTPCDNAALPVLIDAHASMKSTISLMLPQYVELFTSRMRISFQETATKTSDEFMSEIEDIQQSWIQLCSQALTDCTYLDDAVQTIVPSGHSSESRHLATDMLRDAVSQMMTVRIAASTETCLTSVVEELERCAKAMGASIQSSSYTPSSGESNPSAHAESHSESGAQIKNVVDKYLDYLLAAMREIKACIDITGQSKSSAKSDAMVASFVACLCGNLDALAFNGHGRLIAGCAVLAPPPQTRPPASTSSSKQEQHLFLLTCSKFLACLANRLDSAEIAKLGMQAELRLSSSDLEETLQKRIQESASTCTAAHMEEEVSKSFSLAHQVLNAALAKRGTTTETATVSVAAKRVAVSVGRVGSLLAHMTEEPLVRFGGKRILMDAMMARASRNRARARQSQSALQFDVDRMFRARIHVCHASAMAAGTPPDVTLGLLWKSLLKAITEAVRNSSGDLSVPSMWQILTDVEFLRAAAAVSLLNCQEEAQARHDATDREVSMPHPVQETEALAEQTIYAIEERGIEVISFSTDDAATVIDDALTDVARSASVYV